MNIVEKIEKYLDEHGTRKMVIDEMASPRAGVVPRGVDKKNAIAFVTANVADYISYCEKNAKGCYKQVANYEKELTRKPGQGRPELGNSYAHDKKWNKTMLKDAKAEARMWSDWAAQLKAGNFDKSMVLGLVNLDSGNIPRKYYQ